MTFLLDTDVISALAPTRARRASELADWLDRHSEHLFLSTITSAEIYAGIAKARRRGGEAKAQALAAWWETVEHLYGERILPFDGAAAACAGRLTDIADASGQAPGFPDIAIAATAQARGHVLLTRNLRHFRTIAPGAMDPFAQLPKLNDER